MNLYFFFQNISLRIPCPARTTGFSPLAFGELFPGRPPLIVARAPLILAVVPVTTRAVILDDIRNNKVDLSKAVLCRID